MKKFLQKHWLLILSLIYLIYPLDLIADIFGPVGLIDDGVILFWAIFREIYLYRKSQKTKAQ